METLYLSTLPCPPILLSPQSLAATILSCLYEFNYSGHLITYMGSYNICLFGTGLCH